MWSAGVFHPRNLPWTVPFCTCPFDIFFLCRALCLHAIRTDATHQSTKPHARYLRATPTQQSGNQLSFVRQNEGTRNTGTKTERSPRTSSGSLCDAQSVSTNSAFAADRDPFAFSSHMLFSNCDNASGTMPEIREEWDRGREAERRFETMRAKWLANVHKNKRTDVGTRKKPARHMLATCNTLTIKCVGTSLLLRFKVRHRSSLPNFSDSARLLSVSSFLTRVDWRGRARVVRFGDCILASGIRTRPEEKQVQPSL